MESICFSYWGKNLKFEKKNQNYAYLRPEGFSRVVRELGQAAFPMLEPVSELT